MPNRDVEFLTFLRRYRARLLGAAFLLHGDAGQAERLVQHAAAAAYVHGERFLTIATEHLVRTDPRLLPVRGEARPPRQRAELIDASAEHRTPAPGRYANASTPTVLARLDELDREARRALVLTRYLRLSSSGTAELLATTADAVEASVSRSLLTLSDLGTPGGGGVLTMMESVIPPAGDVEAAAFSDLSHGRTLVRRRRGRRSLLAVAAVLVLIVIGVAVWPNRVTVVEVNAPPSGTGSSSAPSASAARCTDPKVPACRVEITRDWRYRMATIVTQSLDPKAAYFSGYSFGYDPRYDSDALWQGRGGALGLDVFSATRGSTVVFVQIATSRKTAIRCGATTKHRCIRRQMMDFNYFTMTDTTDSRQGVEVQYRPTGSYVITIIVRDPTKGTPLVVGQGEIINLIEDPRLVMPKL